MSEGATEGVWECVVERVIQIRGIRGWMCTIGSIIRGCIQSIGEIYTGSVSGSGSGIRIRI